MFLIIKIINKLKELYESKWIFFVFIFVFVNCLVYIEKKKKRFYLYWFDILFVIVWFYKVFF